MGLHSFGLIPKGHKTEFRRLLETSPVIRPIAAQWLGRIAYQTEFGIFRHDRPHDRPLAIVAQHPKEDIHEGGMTFTYIRKYYHYRIHKHFGLSMDAFFELPFHVACFILEIAKEEAVSQSREMDNVKKGLEDDLDNI